MLGGSGTKCGDAEQHIATQLAEFELAQPAKVHIVTESPDFAILKRIERHSIELARVPGMGVTLAGRFRRTVKDERHAKIDSRNDPTIAELLDIDRQYRRLVQEDRLPILHTQRADRHYTVLFSNTVRAHDLGTTHDWVLINRDDHEHQGQWTVITSQYGKLRGKRIVCGREDECSDFYRQEQGDRTTNNLFNRMRHLSPSSV